MSFQGQEAKEIENLSEFNKKTMRSPGNFKEMHYQYGLMKRCLTKLCYAMALKFTGQEVAKDEYLENLRHDKSILSGYMSL